MGGNTGLNISWNQMIFQTLFISTAKRNCFILFIRMRMKMRAECMLVMPQLGWIRSDKLGPPAYIHNHIGDDDDNDNDEHDDDEDDLQW